jgi:antibiotic biosynthesis monooxygenase (ABM) superfamily enzyme
LGSSIFHPASIEDPEYRVIFKFDRLTNLRRWEASEERQRWFTQAEALTECPPKIQVLTGLETWFTLPGKAAIVPPPRYKMALVTWVTVFPLITVISQVLHNPLLPLPSTLRIMIITAIAVPTMTYVLMPRMTQFLSGWLYPSTAEQPADPIDEVVPLALEAITAQPFSPSLALDRPLPMTLNVEPSEADLHPTDEHLTA